MMVWIAVFSSLLAGAGVAVQSPMMAFASQRVGLLPGVLVSGLSGIVCLGALVLVFGGASLESLTSLPWFVYLAGPIGVGVMTAMAFAVPRIGMTLTLVLSVGAQLALAAGLDHLGFLGLEIRRVGWSQVAGLAAVIVGIVLISRR